jgi:hypothetical protein
MANMKLPMFEQEDELEDDDEEENNEQPDWVW